MDKFNHSYKSGNTDEIVRIMKEGGYTIDYAPVSGGFCLFKCVDSEIDYINISYEDFINLQDSQRINKKETRMKGCHPLFHEQVDIYSII